VDFVLFLRIFVSLRATNEGLSGDDVDFTLHTPRLKRCSLEFMFAFTPPVATSLGGPDERSPEVTLEVW
jgi:hypothetical protein